MPLHPYKMGPFHCRHINPPVFLQKAFHPIVHCTVRKQGDLCVYSGKVPFRMDEESMVQRLTRIKELNGKLSRPPHYAHGTSRDHTYTTSSKGPWLGVFMELQFLLMFSTIFMLEGGPKNLRQG